MSSLAEKRVYSDRTGATTTYVATGAGVVSVSVADDRIGEFGIDRRCAARDVAAAPGALAVATDESVLFASADADGYADLDFGPAVAVGFDGDSLLAADEGGQIGRTRPGGQDATWRTLGTLDADARAIDGDLIATDAGVHRARTDGVAHAGLDRARDVSAPGAPLAATDDGLYRLGNGWMEERDGRFRVVAAGPEGDPGTIDRAYAATRSALFAREGGEWRERSVPADAGVADVAVARNVYAVAADGTFLVDAGDGWRSRALGLRDVSAVAVP